MDRDNDKMIMIINQSRELRLCGTRNLFTVRLLIIGELDSRYVYSAGMIIRQLRVGGHGEMHDSVSPCTVLASW